MKKVVVINEGYSDNLGDKAINIALTELLKKNGIKVYFEGYSCIKEKELIPSIDKFNAKTEYLKKIKPLIKLVRYLKIQKIKCMQKKRIKNIVSSHRDKDAFIFGGGQLVQSNGIFPYLLKEWMNGVINSNKKMIFFGAGIGKNLTNSDEKELRELFSKVEKFYARDSYSFKRAKEWCREAELMPDVVFGKTVKKVIKKDKTVLLGVVEKRVYDKFNPMISQEEFYSWWLEKLKYYRNQNLKVKGFYTTKNDYLETVKFNNYLKKIGEKQIEILKINNLSSLTECINDSSVIISGRMHGLILASIYGKELVPFKFSQKVKSFVSDNLKEVGIDSYKLTDEKFTELKNLVEFNVLSMLKEI